MTDWETAIGLPMASTTSPTFNWFESPHMATGSGGIGLLARLHFSFSTAMSANGSVPIFVASTSSPSAIVQMMRMALPATWWFCHDIARRWK